MKPFLSFLTECTQKYEFKVKIAGVEMTDQVKDQLEHALSAYSIDSISKPQHLPIASSHLDFPTMENVEVYMINVTLKYPCTDEQLRQTIASQGRIPMANVVIVPKNQPEELQRELDANKKEDSKALLDTEDLGGESAQEQVGDKKISSFLKDLQTRKYDIEGSTEKAKTTNDLPMNNTSPIKPRKLSK